MSQRDQEEEVLEGTVVGDDDSPETSLPYANPLLRLIAFLLDAILAGALGIFLIGFVIWPKSYPGAVEEFLELAEQQEMTPEELQETISPNLRKAIWTGQLVMFLVVWLYFFASATITGGSSLGKAVFRLRVVDSSGTPTPALKTALREGLKALCFFSPTPIIFILAYIPTVVTSSRQSFPDLIARTIVINR